MRTWWCWCPKQWARTRIVSALNNELESLCAQMASIPCAIKTKVNAQRVLRRGAAQDQYWSSMCTRLRVLDTVMEQLLSLYDKPVA